MSEWNYKACADSAHQLAAKIDPRMRLGDVCWRCVQWEAKNLRAENADLKARLLEAVEAVKLVLKVCVRTDGLDMRDFRRVLARLTPKEDK